jgi:hypothetical protein
MASGETDGLAARAGARRMSDGLSNEILDRAPPSDVAAEKALLGSVLVSTTQDTFDQVAELISPRDFYDNANRIIFEHMQKLHRDGKPIDSVLLANSLKDAAAGDVSAFKEVGAVPYLATLIKGVPNHTHARYYATTVKEAADKRRLLDLGSRMTQAAHNGQLASDIISELQLEISDLGRAAQVRFPRITAAELVDTKYELEYLIDGVLCGKHNCGWIGGSKTLKTTLLIDAAIALSTGGHFLGYFPVTRPCVVGVMSGESGMPTIQETAIRIARKAGVDLRGVDRLIFSDRLPQLASPDDLIGLKRWIEYDDVEVLIVDPAYLCMDLDGRESSLFAVGGVLTRVSELCQDLGVTFVLAHHTKQSTAADFEPPKLSDASWAGFEQFFRQWIVIKRRKTYEPGTGDHDLWLSTGGSMGHSSLVALAIHEGVGEERTWNVEVRSASDAIDFDKRQQEHLHADREHQKDRDDRRRLLESLRAFPDGETKSTLRDSSGLNSSKFGTALTCLIKDGLAESCNVAKVNGRDYAGFRPTKIGLQS